MTENAPTGPAPLLNDGSGEPVTFTKYDRRSLSYASTFDHPVKSGIISAIELFTGKLKVLRLIRQFEKQGAPTGQGFWRAALDTMGIDLTTGLAFTKSQIAAGGALPEGGTVFLSLADRDKAVGLEAARGFVELGLDLAATSGTAEHLRSNDLPVSTVVAKLGEEGTDAVQLVRSGAVQLVVNSPRGRGPRADGEHIRAAAGAEGVPLLTTGNAALAAARGLADWRTYPLAVRTLQEYHQGIHFDSGVNGS